MEPTSESERASTRRQRGAARGTAAAAFRDVAPYLGIGVTLAATVGLGVLVGYWLGGRFGMAPVGLVIGGVLGVSVGLYHFYRTVSDKR